MTEEIGRMLAFLFLVAVLAMLFIAVLRSFEAAVREVWRSRQGRRDLRTLAQYEGEFRPASEYERLWGDS